MSTVNSCKSLDKIETRLLLVNSCCGAHVSPLAKSRPIDVSLRREVEVELDDGLVGDGMGEKILEQV